MSRFAPHRTSGQPRANSSTVCQKCLKTGHFIYECKSERPYVSRPSRTQQLESPNVLAKLKAAKPSLEVPEEFKQKYIPVLLAPCVTLIRFYFPGTAQQTASSKGKRRSAKRARNGRPRRPDAGGCMRSLHACLSNNLRPARLLLPPTRTRIRVPIRLALVPAQILARAQILQGGQENATGNGASPPNVTVVRVAQDRHESMYSMR
ncbi:zinc knuckle-domain-containing protein [Mycena olivaceomarginata]|nr:zinc knuckle-domain-containing protein [Mycena olivaceomarginata]